MAILIDWDLMLSDPTDDTKLNAVVYNLANLTFEDDIVMSDASLDVLYNHLQKMCGTVDAALVSEMHQQNELEHLGKSCIMVPRQVQKLFEKKLGTFEEIKKHALNMEFTEVGATASEKKLLYEIVIMMNNVYSFATIDRIKICKFENDIIYALHGTKTGTIYLNKDVLNAEKELWITLAHEFAHDFGEDGTKRHLEAVQIILAECLLMRRF